MPAVKNVLVLGGGLGSMVYVLDHKGYSPAISLVEQDKVVLRMAIDLFAAKKIAAKVEPVCSDALAHMERNKAKYDLVFIDVFNGRVVPDFVTSSAFLMLCKNAMADGGHLAFNYIINDDQEWETTKQTFASIFPEYKEIAIAVNRILIV